MKIESLKYTKPRKEIFELKTDSGDVIEFDAEIVIKHKLAQGLELDRERFDAIQKENQFILARKLGVAYCVVDLKPSGIVRRYLLRKEVGDKEFIESIIQYLVDRKFINDQEYGRRFVRTQKNKQSLGIRKIRHDLKGKGLADKLIDELLEEIEQPQEQLNSAFAQLTKKFRNVQISDDPKLKKRAWSFLQRKGFESESINQAVEQWLNGKNDES